MAFLQVLLRVVLLLFAVRLIGRFLASLLPLGAPRPAAETGALVRDRICNTFLPRERALRAFVGGREEHFCSADCRDRALSGISGG
jgi:hypothetical protein